MSVEAFDKQWNFRDPGATAEVFRGLLPEATEHSLDLELQVLTQIARCHGLQREFDEAKALLAEVASRLGPEETTAKVRYLLELGRAHRSSGDTEASVPLFEEAFELSKANGSDRLTVDAAHMMGIVAEGDAGLQWNLDAIALAEASTQENAKSWLGSLYNNTAWSLHDLGRLEEALDLFERAERWFERKPGTVPHRIARWAVARCMRSMGRAEEALAIQDEVIAMWEEAGEVGGYAWEEKAECLLLLERPVEAASAFAMAYEALSGDDFMVRNEPERLARMKELSEGT